MSGNFAEAISDVIPQLTALSLFWSKHTVELLGDGACIHNTHDTSAEVGISVQTADKIDWKAMAQIRFL